MIIIVTGPVTSGKTALSKALAKELNYKYLNPKILFKKYKLIQGYDKKLKSNIINIKKLNKILIKIIKENKNLIIDSHLSHYLPNKYVDLCIVTKCNLKTLKKRLIKRKYSKIKIDENMECEIMDVCLMEAKELKHNILIVDTTNRINIKRIIKCLERKRSR